MRTIGTLLLLVALGGCQPTPTAKNSDQPKRIASLNLATDEILAELVPAERVACVTVFADSDVSNIVGHYPKSIPRLAGLDVEKLLGLQPDLILVAPYNNADAVELIKKSGKPVYRYDAVKSLDDIAASILTLGQQLGEADKAKKLADDFQKRRRDLANRIDKVKERPRVLLWAGGFSAGRETTIHDIILAAGARNVAAEMDLKGNPEITPERVIVENPDYVLVGGLPGDEVGGVMNHPILRRLPAVEAKRVVRIEGRYLSSISHHAIEAAERLARILHPDCFKDRP